MVSSSDPESAFLHGVSCLACRNIPPVEIRSGLAQGRHDDSIIQVFNVSWRDCGRWFHWASRPRLLLFSITHGHERCESWDDMMCYSVKHSMIGFLLQNLFYIPVRHNGIGYKNTSVLTISINSHTSSNTDVLVEIDSGRADAFAGRWGGGRAGCSTNKIGGSRRRRWRCAINKQLILSS